jgi:nitroreductase
VREGKGHLCIACGHCVAVCPFAALDNVRAPLEKQVELGDFPVLDAATAASFLRSRRSIRCYKSELVSRKKLLQLLDIARFAPSGHNSQGLSYLLVEGPEDVRLLSETVIAWMQELITSQSEMARRYHMPAIVRAFRSGEDRITRGAQHVVFAKAPKTNPAAQITAYLALEYVELYATTLGLGTCWAGYVQTCAVHYPPFVERLGISADEHIAGAMMVGYPIYRYHRLPDRNPLEVKWLGE